MTFPLGSLQRDGSGTLAAQRPADQADVPRWRCVDVKRFGEDVRIRVRRA